MSCKRQAYLTERGRTKPQPGDPCLGAPPGPQDCEWWGSRRPGALGSSRRTSAQCAFRLPPGDVCPARPRGEAWLYLLTVADTHLPLADLHTLVTYRHRHRHTHTHTHSHTCTDSFTQMFTPTRSWSHMIHLLRLLCSHIYLYMWS